MEILKQKYEDTLNRMNQLVKDRQMTAEQVQVMDGMMISASEQSKYMAKL